MSQLNEAERRFVAYLESHGYAWSHEPDYQRALGLSAPSPTTPDFLVRRDGDRAVCEVRQFEGTAIRDALALAGRYMTTGPEMILKPVRWALVEKAKQLLPLADARVPLVIVLANPRGADVILDQGHITAAMFGNASVRFPIDPRIGGMPEGAQPHLALEDYGVFRSPVLRDGRIVAWENRNPHVSAVAVVCERLHSTDWRECILDGYRSVDDTMEAGIDAMFEANREVSARVEAGEEPPGAYQWVNLYELDGEAAVPVPACWFNGSRDVRYGFRSEGAYGQLPSDLSS